jgi:hypothetical protein
MPTVAQLKSRCKRLGVKGYSNRKKTWLVKACSLHRHTIRDMGSNGGLTHGRKGNKIIDMGGRQGLTKVSYKKRRSGSKLPCAAGKTRRGTGICHSLKKSSSKKKKSLKKSSSKKMSAKKSSSKKKRTSSSTKKKRTSSSTKKKTVRSTK